MLHSSTSFDRWFVRRASAQAVAVFFFVFWIADVGYARPHQAAATTRSEIQDHLQKGQAALQARDAQIAEKEFLAVLSLDPRNAIAHTNLGVLALGRGDCRTGAEHFRSALAAQPSLTRAQALLGICLKRLGDPAARSALEKSFPKLQEKPLRIQVGMELAGLYDSRGDLDATASVMRSLVALDPENVDILFAAQRVYSELADDTLNKLAVVAPGSARMQQVIAERLVNAGDLKGAIEHYQNALEIDPRLPGVHFELAEAILESSPADLSAQDQAQKELETTAKAEGDSARIEVELGRIAFLRSNMDDALACYRRAFALDPHYTAAQIGVGKLLSTLDKPQDAVKYLRMAVQSDPLNAEAHYRLATVCRKLQLTEEAEKEIRLFQEIKQTKERVRQLYRQMNKATKEPDDQFPDEKPQG
jgi:tetratricopeptide (TPR) repeat protein